MSTAKSLTRLGVLCSILGLIAASDLQSQGDPVIKHDQPLPTASGGQTSQREMLLSLFEGLSAVRDTLTIEGLDDIEETKKKFITYLAVSENEASRKVRKNGGLHLGFSIAGI